MSNTSTSKHFCILPFIHLHLESTGDLNPCPINTTNLGNINDQPIKTLWQSDQYQQLRTALLNDEYVSSCEICYSQERGRGNSVRTRCNEKFQQFVPQANPIANDPVYFDLRFSNLCNLKCRSCEHKSSSFWFDDAKALGLLASDKALMKATENSDSLLAQIGAYIPQAVEFYFAGGEPLVMEEHYSVLDMLIAQKRTDVKLVYNTNFMKIKFKDKSIFDYWNHFDHVEIHVSLDAINEVAGYVRKGTKFTELVNNRKLLREHSPHVKVGCAPTISILNIGTLDALLDFIVTAEFCPDDQVYLNILEYPLHYNIKMAPESVKRHIASQLLQCHRKMQNQKNIQDQLLKVIRYMESGDLSEHLAHFKSQTKKLDALRGESFEDIFGDEDPVRIIMEETEVVLP